MKPRRQPTPDNGPSQWERDEARRAVVGREYWVAVDLFGDLPNTLHTDPDECARTTCPKQQHIFKVRIVAQRKYPKFHCKPI